MVPENRSHAVFHAGDGRLCRSISLRAAAGLEKICAPVVSAVGAGGKTSTLRRLAQEYIADGQKVIVLTTTHMVAEDRPWFLLEPSEKKMRELLAAYGQAWVGTPAPGGKMQGVPCEFLDKIWKTGLPVLIEADGARQLPLKVPGEMEPVILPETTQVLSVYGLDAVGQKLGDICFRAERAAELLGKNITERITAADVAFLAASRRAGRKGCPEGAGYTVILNKADDERRREYALEICRMLQNKAVENVIVSGCREMPEQLSLS